MKNKHKNQDDGINEDYIKWCLSLTPEQRLENLEKLNEFLNNAMPPKNKEIAKILRQEGF